MSESLTGTCQCQPPAGLYVAGDKGYCLDCGKKVAREKKNGAKIDPRVLRAKFDRFKRDILARFREIEEEFDRMN